MVEIRPRVGGYLTEQLFGDGQMVNKSDRLFTIDPRPSEIALQKAQAQATTAAAQLKALGDWLRDHAVARTRGLVELAADAAASCRALRIEPPTPDRIARVLRTAVRAYEDGRTATVHARLTPAMRVSLDALLQPA